LGKTNNQNLGRDVSTRPTHLVSAQVEQVDEPPGTFIFELEAYPEAKSLSIEDLNTLYVRLKSFYKVADLIGASEAFVRQSHKPHRLNPLSYKNRRK
jgi:hypothetical protein